MRPLNLVYENKVAQDQQFVEVKHKKLKEGTDTYGLCGQTKRRATQISLSYPLAKRKRASQSLDQRQTGLRSQTDTESLSKSGSEG